MKPITFFTGQTADGHLWVLSFEGGPTATEPGRRCRVSGRVGPVLRVSYLDASEGAELRAWLPLLELAEVGREIWAIRIRRRRRGDKRQPADAATPLDLLR